MEYSGTSYKCNDCGHKWKYDDSHCPECGSQYIEDDEIVLNINKKND